MKQIISINNWKLAGLEQSGFFVERKPIENAKFPKSDRQSKLNCLSRFVSLRNTSSAKEHYDRHFSLKQMGDTKKENHQSTGRNCLDESSISQKWHVKNTVAVSKENSDVELRIVMDRHFDATHSTTPSPPQKTQTKTGVEHTEPTKIVSANLPGSTTSNQTRAGVEIFAPGASMSKSNISFAERKKRLEKLVKIITRGVNVMVRVRMRHDC